MARLIDDMLTITAIEAGRVDLHPRTVSIADVVRRALDVTGLDDVVVHGDQLVHAHADPERLEQMLVNLISNAEKYGKPPIELSMGAENCHVTVSVEDHGPGVSDQFRPYLFERFSRDNDTNAELKEGSGLGLSIVMSLARAQNGSVSYRQGNHGGACFELLLPHPRG
jgi:signal transduction histidine kinase